MDNSENRYSAMSDEELAVIAAGDPSAAAELLSRISLIIRSVAASIDPHIADDLFQEGILGALSAVSSYDGKRGSVRTFLVSCAKNRMLSSLKRNSLIGGEYEDVDALAELADDTDKSADEKLSELYGAIDSQLSSAEKKVIMLYISGCSYREISAELSISEKSVDNAMQRARRKLKKHLGK